jgi:hypothetical protein
LPKIEYSIFVEGLRKIIINLNHSRQSLARVLKRGPCEIRGNSAKYPSAVWKEIADELRKCVMLAKHLCRCRNIIRNFMCVNERMNRILSSSRHPPPLRERLRTPANSHSLGGVLTLSFVFCFVDHFVFCYYVNVTRSTDYCGRGGWECGSASSCLQIPTTCVYSFADTVTSRLFQSMSHIF